MVAVLAAAALAGCGSDGREGDGDATAPESATLSQEQFEAIERMYEGMLPIEAIGDDPTAEDVRSTADEIRAICAEDDDDPLVRALLTSCKTTVSAYETIGATADCATAEECGRAIVTSADSLAAALKQVREQIPVIEEHIGPGECRDELTSTGEMDILTEMVATLRTLGDAIRDGDQDAAEQASKTLDRIEELPGARESLATFRRVCAPAGP